MSERKDSSSFREGYQPKPNNAEYQSDSLGIAEKLDISGGYQPTRSAGEHPSNPQPAPPPKAE